MAEFDPRKDGIDFYANQVMFDEAVWNYYKMVEEKQKLFSPQESGRATYKAETPDKDGIKLFLDKEKLAQIAKDGFKEMEQE